MVTGVKPDEQVEWSEVEKEANARELASAGLASGVCSKRGCSGRAVGKVDVPDGFPAVFCASHFFELGAIAALTTFGQDGDVDAIGKAAALAEVFGVSDV